MERRQKWIAWGLSFSLNPFGRNKERVRNMHRRFILLPSVLCLVRGMQTQKTAVDCGMFAVSARVMTVKNFRHSAFKYDLNDLPPYWSTNKWPWQTAGRQYNLSNRSIRSLYFDLVRSGGYALGLTSGQTRSNEAWMRKSSSLGYVNEEIQGSEIIPLVSLAMRNR